MKWKDEKSTCLVCCYHVNTHPNPYPQSSRDQAFHLST